MNEETKQELVAKYRDSYRDYLDDYLDKVKNEGLEVSFSVWVCMRLKDAMNGTANSTTSLKTSMYCLDSDKEAEMNNNDLRNMDIDELRAAALGLDAERAYWKRMYRETESELRKTASELERIKDGHD